MPKSIEQQLGKWGLKAEPLGFGPRRGIYIKLPANPPSGLCRFSDAQLALLDKYNVAYRALCSVLYNSVPQSGHPGGSISSGHIVQSLLFTQMVYNFSTPNEPTNDVLCYAAGHKAMGLYAMWALRNEAVRAGAAELLPAKVEQQLRLEDLLGFRRNPTQDTPLFQEYKAKALDGHPTPATPFVKIATGPSGVGVPTALGYAFGALDTYRDQAPTVHILEGEGGATPGRVAEALAAAASCNIHNVVMHLDWNQASIDSNRVCRDGDKPGDYVQWNPIELFYLHDWNVISVENGHDFRQVIAAQALAAQLRNGQPTGIVYRTVKGWKYGLEGKGSHGAGHAFYSPEYYASLKEFEDTFQLSFPRFDGNKDGAAQERTYWNSLLTFRQAFERQPEMAKLLGQELKERRQELQKAARTPRAGAADAEKIYTHPEVDPRRTPAELGLKAGLSTTLRGTLGNCLKVLNKVSGGGIVGSAADLAGSTSLSNLGADFPKGFYNALANPEARIMAIGGICEDAIGGVMAGIASYGRHIGVSSSYGAFIAALQHIVSRCHGISQQYKQHVDPAPFRPFIMINAHAGIKTGEDGPTHADPQPLQLLQGNFPKGVCLALTPWDSAEIWPLLVAALKARPAVIAPFVTRPNETIPDRQALRLAPAEAAADGVYLIRAADKKAKAYHGTVVLQGSGVASTFFGEVLPKLDGEGYNFNVYYVASADLFDLLPAERQREIFPAERAAEAIGITDFTQPTICRWVTSEAGRRQTLHPFRLGHYLGSGNAAKVMKEARLDAAGQYQALVEWAKTKK